MDLATFASSARRRWRFIIVSGLAAGLIALAISSVLPRQYTAESRVLVGSLTETTTDKLTAYQELASTYSVLLSTSDSLVRIGTAAGVAPDPVALAAAMSARVPATSSIITIDATWSTPESAARLAQSAAAEVLRLSTTSGTPLATTVQAALVPREPSSPRTSLNASLAVLVGLALGSLIAFILEYREEQRQGLRNRARMVTLLEERFGRRAG